MENVIIPLKNKGEEEMADFTPLKCSKCKHEEILLMCKGDVTITGIMKCNKSGCNNEQPFTMVNNYLQEIMPNLPVEESHKLNSTVAIDIIEDIKEAERSEYLQCHKAAATMCRRALQLSLIDKGIQDRKLGGMIEDAKKEGLLNEKTYNLAKSIKGLGDIGAHRRELLDRSDIQVLVNVTVKMLNELDEHSTKPAN